MSGAPAAAVHFDAAALRGFLAKRFGAAEDFALERIGGGQSNPTYFLSYGGRDMVLRKQPGGPILRGAHAVDREFRVLSALSDTPVPVPRPVLFHDDPALLGTPFYLMERVQGRVFGDAALPGVPPAERRAMYLSMARTLAALHAQDPQRIGLGDYGRPGDYFERQLARWSGQYDASPAPRIPALDRVIGWLGAALPPDDGQVAIAHGDFRVGNMIFHPTRPEVVGVLDWELSTLGHPLADLGFCCMPWHSAPREYGGLLGLDLHLMGIPSEAEFVAEYYAAAVPTGALLPFHKVFALFRFSVIFVGIADRAAAGTAASGDASRVGSLAERFAARALALTGDDG